MACRGDYQMQFRAVCISIPVFVGQLVAMVVAIYFDAVSGFRQADVSSIPSR